MKLTSGVLESPGGLHILKVSEKQEARQVELEEVRKFAAEQGFEDLQAWDIPYYSEQLRQQKYTISKEELKPWFPEPHVVSGLFAIVERLYGLQIEAVEDIFPSTSLR